MRLAAFLLLYVVSVSSQSFEPDFSSTESALRTFILQGDVQGAASVLSGSEDVFSLGAGLQRESPTPVPSSLTMFHDTASFSKTIQSWENLLSISTETEEKLRSAILDRDSADTIWILRDWSDQLSLGKGLSFPSGLRVEALHHSMDREHDLDVFIFKTMAKVAVATNDDLILNKLAFISVLSTFRECSTCKKGIKSINEYDEIFRSLRSDFDDKQYLHQLIASDSNSESSTCMGCTQVNSFICVNCWPNKSCQVFWWCAK